MADILFVSSTGLRNAGASSTIVLPALAVTTGNAIIVTTGTYGANGAIASIADTAGNTYQQALSGSNPSDATQKICCWYALNVTGHAANIITVTLAGSTPYRNGIACQYSGIATASALDQV